MATGYPDGCTPDMQDAAHGSYSIDEENERRRVAEMLAEQDWDDYVASVCTNAVQLAALEEVHDFVISNAGDYLPFFVAGGDYAAAAMRDLRRDCIACLAENMAPARIDMEIG